SDGNANAMAALAGHLRGINKIGIHTAGVDARAWARPPLPCKDLSPPCRQTPKHYRLEGYSPSQNPQANEGGRLVGETGFEPATPWSRTRCSTRLSHSPTEGRRK